MKYFILFLFASINTNAMASAECSESSYTKQAVGAWELKLQNGKKTNSLSLVISNDGYFFGGYIIDKSTKSKLVDVQACEGDCCNGFSQGSGILNFWVKNPVELFRKKGRVTLIFNKINWKSKSAAGEIRDHSWSKISDFRAKKL